MRYVNARNTAYGEDRRTYKESDSGVSSTQRAFNVSYDNGRVEAYLNGVRLFPGDDYTKTSSGIGTSITLASDLGSNNVLEIVGYQGINSGNALVEDNFVVGTGSTGSGGSYTNSTTVFPVASSAGDTVSVWRNGVKLVPTTDYTVQVSANTVTLLSAASSDDEITVQVVGVIAHNDFPLKSGMSGAVFNTDNNTFTMPTTRGSNNYVLTRDDTIGTGGTTWRETEVSPSTASISPTEVESGAGGNITFTLTGTNYASSGMSVHFLATSGSDITSGMTVTHTSGTSLSVEIAKNLFVDANEPYSVKVTKLSGLTHTLSDAVRVDNAPSFTASPNTVVATVQELIANNTHYTIAASDLESDAITFEEVGTTLLDKFTSATPRGVQSDGTIKGVPLGIGADNQETTFTVRAKSTGDGGATEKQTDQAFKFVVTAKPQLFQGLAYTGTDGTDSKELGDTYNDEGVNTPRDLKPDLVWIKNRTEGYGAHAYDVLRGAQYHLRTATQATSSNSGTTTNLTAFETDGFEVGSSVGVNGGSGDNYVAWCFKAGGSASGTLAGSGETASLTDGFGAGTIHNSATGVSGVKTITQTVNQKGGFSITKYDGDANSGTATFPHNLDGAPDFVLVKKTSEETWGWWVTYHSSLTDNHNLNLNENYAEFPSTNTSYAKGGWIDAPSSTLINLSGGSSNTDSVSYENKDYICYAWKAVTGVSAFGSFNGNSTNDVTVTVGFQPRFVMIKDIDAAGHWIMWDSFRGFGANAHYFKANDVIAEVTVASRGCTVTSNSFTPKHYHTQNSNKFIYVAFA